MLSFTVQFFYLLALLQLLVVEVKPQRITRSICVPGKAQVPNPNDRHSFYKCDAGGNPILFQCPPGTWFNPRLEVCDWDTEGGSNGQQGGNNGQQGGNNGQQGGNNGQQGGNNGQQGGNNGQQGGNNGQQGGNNGQQGGNNGQNPSWNSNQNNNGRWPVNNAPDFATGGNWWSHENQRPENQPEAPPATARPSGTSVTPAVNATCNPRGPLFYRNTENCATFFTCNQGRMALSYCPRGTYYDPDIARCENYIPDGCRVVDQRRQNGIPIDESDNNVWQYRRSGK